MNKRVKTEEELEKMIKACTYIKRNESRHNKNDYITHNNLEEGT